MTPKEMPACTLYAERSQALHAQISNKIADLKEKQILSAPLSMISSGRGTRIVGRLKLTMSDVLEGVPSFKLLYSDQETYEDTNAASPSISVFRRETRPFGKILLRKIDTIVLFEWNSTTVLNDDDEAIAVEYDNKLYDYLTNGDGSSRVVQDAETQTQKNMTFNCKVGTQYIEQQSKCVGTSMKFENNLGGKILTNCHKVLSSLTTIEAFSMAAMQIERALAGNFYITKQYRFRNIHGETISKPEYSYKVNELFRFIQPTFETYENINIKVRKAASDISFCFGNSDLIAVAYGTYAYVSQKQPKTGNVCIWNIKNPQNPERTYSYEAPVTAIAFSPFSHSLLAVATSNGWVEVRDIITQHEPPLAVIDRTQFLSCREPIVTIKWFMIPQSFYSYHHHFLTFTRSAIVQKFRFLRGPYLNGMELTRVDRVVGKVEGLPLIGDPTTLKFMVYRRPIGLNLTLDMKNADQFYLLTDQGCLHKCSMRFTYTNESTLRTHCGAVNCMEFSPWSPKIFLTCGNDWYIRIWMTGIYEPLCALTYKEAPINHAAWSPTHSTILYSLNRDTLDIWDLQHNLFKPKQSISFEKGFNTLFRLSPSGSSIIVGKEMGDAIVCTLDEMPLPTHFQYDTLEKALSEAIEKQSVRYLFKEAGFFGYYNKESRKSFPNVYARI
ncbi:dynein axonemal intermediate chain 4-like [Eurosta solidaginis]|uniref:dynein axonemal intermediate chain 4-like n=1 Tax=Eurosta solidaginis TaxID=178769 RepID=UPI0035310602